jgi:hypothetical protein
MTAKIGQARREAFLAALRETGNQTIAAERAKVSSSWVQLHKSRDPGFRCACEEAVRQARERLCAAPKVGPPSAWEFHEGEELVVRGTGGSGGGRRVQIARARLRQWSPLVEERFVVALAATCNVKAACAEVGLSPASAYNHRQRWPKFGERWDAAIEIGYDRIEWGLLELACDRVASAGPIGLRPMPEMSVRDALQLLGLHERRARGNGRAPGRWRRPRSLDDPDMREEILRKLEAIERLRLAELAEEEEDEEQEREGAA